MSDRSSEESHTVQDFAEQYVESLQPREDRYETRLGDDFYVCTFPNGLKTWLYVYEVNGYRRRRTLGTYPELSLTDAREALFAARKLQRAEEELIERGLGEAVLRGGEAPRARQGEARTGARAEAPLGRRVLRTLGTAAVGAVVAIGGMFAWGTWTTRPLTQPAAPVAARSTAGEAGTPRQSPAARPGGDTAPDGRGVGTVPAEREATPAPGDGEPRVASGAAPASPAAASAERPRTAQPGAGAEDGQTATGEPAGEEASAQARAESAQDVARLLELQASMKGVSLEMLARRIEDGQPDGQIGDHLELGPDEVATVHYFTEVRGMQGRTLTHRWLHDQHEVALVPLQAVGQAWRYPLISTMQLDGSSAAGQWQVELHDEDGEILEDHRFVVELAARD